VSGPELGETPEIVGATVTGVLYVKPLALVPLCPSGFVTTTLTAPAACAGVTAVMVVLLVTLTLVAADPPIVTDAPETKLVPVIVTEVPPVVGPDVGDMPETVGAGGVEYVKPLASVPL